MGTTLPRIIVAESFRPDVVQRLRQHADVVEIPDPTPERLLAEIPKADAILMRMRATMTARIMEAAPRLRVIARAGGTLEHIDMREAHRRNITVIHTPHVASVSVAEYIVGMMLAASRRLVWYDRRVRENRLDVGRAPFGREVRHMTIGLLGSGPVMDELSRILCDGFRAAPITTELEGLEPPPSAAAKVQYDDLLRRSDVLAIHVLGGDRYVGFIDAAALSAMRPTTFLISTSRGVVDSRALAEALKTHRLAGAAMDGFDPEELTDDHPLRNAPNCLLTPRVASSTLDVVDAYSAVADDLVRVLRGQPPQHSVASE